MTRYAFLPRILYAAEHAVFSLYAVRTTTIFASLSVYRHLFALSVALLFSSYLAAHISSRALLSILRAWLGSRAVAYGIGRMGIRDVGACGVDFASFTHRHCMAGTAARSRRALRCMRGRTRRARVNMLHLCAYHIVPLL